MAKKLATAKDVRSKFSFVSLNQFQNYSWKTVSAESVCLFQWLNRNLYEYLRKEKYLTKYEWRGDYCFLSQRKKIAIKIQSTKSWRRKQFYINQTSHHHLGIIHLTQRVVFNKFFHSIINISFVVVLTFVHSFTATVVSAFKYFYSRKSLIRILSSKNFYFYFTFDVNHASKKL